MSTQPVTEMRTLDKMTIPFLSICVVPDFKLRMEDPPSISPCETPLLATGNLYLREVGSVGGYWIELAPVSSQ
jgi:hypothetical protein